MTSASFSEAVAAVGNLARTGTKSLERSRANLGGAASFSDFASQRRRHVCVTPAPAPLCTAFRCFACLSGLAGLCRAVQGPIRHGRYWARTSDLRLVEAALSQLS